MLLIGEKFATYLMLIDGETSIVKMEDYPVPERENTRCYREYLAYRLASQIELPMPRTGLRQDQCYGRLSVQKYIHGATKPTPALLEEMVTSSFGIRIALFDVLCGNHDRKPDNLLQLGTDIIPIDFNTAFQEPATGCDFDEEADTILNRWFRIRGILSLVPSHRDLLLAEAQQMVERLDNSILYSCLTDIPSSFCDPIRAGQLRNFLIARRDQLIASASKWWHTNVAPLHTFDGDALVRVMHKHLGEIA